MLSAYKSFSASSLRLLQYVSLVSAMGIIFGCDLGTLFINNQNYTFNSYLFSINRSHVVLGTYVLGFIFGTFISGYVTYGSGRKLTIISSGIIGAFAILSSVVAPNFAILLCSEFVIGFSSGLYIIAASLYNCEISLPRWRSLASIMLPNCIAFGCLLSLLTYHDLASKPFVFFILLVIFSLIIIAFMIVKMPESPRYLALTGSSDAALSVLFQLRHDMGKAARELAQINECCRGESRGLEFFMQNRIYLQLLSFLCLGIFLMDIGGVFVLPYVFLDNLSLYLFCPQDNYCYFKLNNAMIYTTFVVIFLSICLHTLALERFSRRTVILGSISIACVFLFFTTLTTMFAESTIKNYVLTFLILGFIFFSLGGHTTFLSVLVTELLPIRGREFSLAVIYLSHGIGLLFSLQLFMPAIHQLGFISFLAILTLLLMLALYIINLYLPNTNNTRSLENLELHLLSFSKLASLRQFDQGQDRQ